MIVAHHRDHAAQRRGSRRIGVLEHIGGAIDAGPLAVPDAEHALHGRLGQQRRLLRPPDRRRGDVLVQPRHEMDGAFRQVLLRLVERIIVCAERRSAIARDEARGIQPRRDIALPLKQWQPHERLHARHVGDAVFQRIFVVESDRSQHVNSSAGRQKTPGYRPPSSRMFWPVMYPANALHTKAQVAPNSSGRPNRFAGERS